MIGFPDETMRRRETPSRPSEKKREAARGQARAPARPPAGSSPDAARLRRSLLRWYRATARDMPWRRTREPYPVWISEVMLQQTTVATVTPYYERFLRDLPTVEAL